MSSAYMSMPSSSKVSGPLSSTMDDIDLRPHPVHGLEDADERIPAPPTPSRPRLAGKYISLEMNSFYILCVIF